MKLLTGCPCRILFLLTILVVTAVQPPRAHSQPTAELSPQLPTEVRQALQELPGQRLVPDVVLEFGLRNSLGYQQARLPEFTRELQRLRAEAALDTVINGGYEWRMNKSEVIAPFSPQTTATSNYSLGVRTLFPTGTSLEASYGTTNIDLEYPPLPQGFPGSFREDPYYESLVQFSLTQDLWRNFFGNQQRKVLEAARSTDEVVDIQVRENLSVWAFDLMRAYYAAWLGQTQLAAARDNLERQQRLLNITNIQRRRGTVEEADLLQVRAATIEAETLVSEAEQTLNSMWRTLVIQLEAPPSWLDADPDLVPIGIDNPVPDAIGLCGTAEQLNAVPEEVAARVRRLRKQLRQAELRLEAARDGRKPSLKLQLSLGANGIDDYWENSSREAARYESPNTAVGVALAIPINNTEANANIAEALGAQKQVEIQLGQALSQLQTDWLNGCRNLFRLSKLIQEQQRLLEVQQRRARLEERQFQLGRTPAFDVIQAGREATQAEVNLRQMRSQINEQAWVIRDLTDRIYPYLQNLTDKNLGAPQ